MSEIGKGTNNQLITEYLLGSLPEAKTEHFDELSISDDEFAETLRIVEKDLLDAYAQGELTGSVLERFESYYLASPSRRQKVQFALALQSLGEASPSLKTAGETDKQSDSVVNQEGTSWWSVFSSSWLRPQALRFVGAVAALIIMVLGGWMVFENLRLRRELSQTLAQRDSSDKGIGLQRELEQTREERDRLEQELKQTETAASTVTREPPRAPNRGTSIASFVLNPQVRSVGQINTISIPINATQVAFRLELEPNDYTAYRATLLNNEQVLWQSGTLKPSTKDGSQSVRVWIGTHLLKTGIHTLRINGISSTGPEFLSDYPFRVVK